MSKFYSVLLDDEMHYALKKKSFETKTPISALVRSGIALVLKDNNYKRSEGMKND